MKNIDFIKATLFVLTTIVVTDVLAYLRRGEFVFYDQELSNHPGLIIIGTVLIVVFIYISAYLLYLKRKRDYS